MTNLRPALAPREMCPLPEGRKLLPRAWWRDPEFVPGSLLRHREECRQRRVRVAVQRKRPITWDQARQNETRTLACWRWQFAPGELWSPSKAVH